MELFDRLSNTLSTVGKDGMEKARELKDATRIAMEIKEREGAIQKMYRELGKAYYQDHKADAIVEYDQVAEIKAAHQEIGELKAAKDEIRGIKRCASCGEALIPGTKFCAHCGTEIKEVVPAVECMEEEEVEILEDEIEETEEAEAVEETAEAAEEAAEEVAEEAVEVETEEE